MTLLGKRVSKMKNLMPGLIILISVFYGCETSEEPGIEYPLNTNVNVKLKEFILPASNLYIDSLRTDSEGRILVGNYTDPIFGTIKAEGYMSLSYVLGSLPGNQILSGYVYDSARISIINTPSLITNGASNQSFKINQLIDTLQSDLKYLANLKKASFREIGSHQFSVLNSADTTYGNILLSNAFGSDLFQKGLENGTMATSDWPSIGISAGMDSELISSVLMSNDTSRLYLYITSPDAIREIVNMDTSFRDTTYRAEFVFSTTNFTHLDRSGSQFDGTPEKTDFDFADGSTMIDPLFGVSTSLNVDQLADFFEENENILLNDVTLSFEFDVDGDTSSQVTNFMAYIRKEDNGFFGPAVFTTAASFSNIIMSDEAYLGQSTSPSFAHLSTSKTKILLRATLFFQSVYQEYLDTQILQFKPLEDVIKPISEFVLISPTDVTLNRTIFKKNGIKLRVYYTEVDE